MHEEVLSEKIEKLSEVSVTRNGAVVCITPCTMKDLNLKGIAWRLEASQGVDYGYGNLASSTVLGGNPIEVNLTKIES